jgi:hypothetical protein
MSDDREDFRGYGAGAAKLLAHLDVLREARDERVLRPVQVKLAPTEACDSHCSYCSTAGRPVRRYLPFDELCSLLWAFRDLGARALELEGGGNPLLYKDRDTGEDLADVVTAAWGLGYQVGIITNSADLTRLHRVRDMLAWVRVSLPKLEEGLTAADYDLGGIAEEKVGFSQVWHAGTPADMGERLAALTVRFPRARFVREVDDYLGSAPAPGRVSLPLAGGFGRRPETQPFDRACYAGLVRPYVAAPPDGVGEYLVYACSCHVLPAQRYDPAFALCTVSEVREAWPQMWQRWREKGAPYEVRGNGGTGWGATCAFCLHGDSNRLLYDAAHPPEDADFA